VIRSPDQQAKNASTDYTVSFIDMGVVRAGGKDIKGPRTPIGASRLTWIRLDSPIFGGTDDSSEKATLIEREAQLVRFQTHRSVELQAVGHEAQMLVSMFERSKMSAYNVVTLQPGKEVLGGTAMSDATERTVKYINAAPLLSQGMASISTKTPALVIVQVGSGDEPLAHTVSIPIRRRILGCLSWPTFIGRMQSPRYEHSKL
jgi:hypothetical protein